MIEMVDEELFEEREVNQSQKKTGKMVPITTLKGVSEIPKLAEMVHQNGGKVIATCVVCNPWILDKLEPYVDGLTFQYTVSPVAMENALGAQMDVLSGAYNPTGKMSLTMVSSPEVIRIEERNWMALCGKYVFLQMMFRDMTKMHISIRRFWRT